MHPIGFGNLPRYVQEVSRPEALRGGLVVEDYSVVIPSTLPDGPITLRVGTDEVQFDIARLTLADSAGEEGRWEPIAR
jgi:hypothetical protein